MNARLFLALLLAACESRLPAAGEASGVLVSGLVGVSPASAPHGAEVYAYDPVSGLVRGFDRVNERGTYRIELPPARGPTPVIFRVIAAGGEFGAVCRLGPGQGQARQDLSATTTFLWSLCVRLAGKTPEAGIRDEKGRASLALANLAIRMPDPGILTTGISRLLGAAPGPQAIDSLASSLAGEIPLAVSRLPRDGPDLPSAVAMKLAVVEAALGHAEPFAILSGAPDPALVERARALDRLAVGQLFPTPPPPLSVGDRLPAGGQEGNFEPEIGEVPIVADATSSR